MKELSEQKDFEKYSLEDVYISDDDYLTEEYAMPLIWYNGTPVEKKWVSSLTTLMRFDRHIKKQKESGDEKIILEVDNKIKLPNELTRKLNLSWGDELFADIFDDELKQIVIGKKLEGEDAIKGLDKISKILTKDL